MKTLFITLFFITLCTSIFAQRVINDPTFDPGDGFNERVLDIALQPDGKIILGVLSLLLIEPIVTVLFASMQTVL